MNLLAAIDLPSQVEIGGRILLAAVLGGLVGFEREVSGQSAGLRTHITVALGAALFGVASAYGFGEFDALRTETNFQVDPTRVASNIVVGIGFLGGGAIVKYGGTVRGLTTAASVWVTAAIGLGCALGSYFATVVTAAALLLALWGLRIPERWIERRLQAVSETVTIRLTSGADPSGVVAAVNDLKGVRITSLVVRDREEGCTIQVTLKGRARTDLEVLLAPLADRSDVSDLDVT